MFTIFFPLFQPIYNVCYHDNLQEGCLSVLSFPLSQPKISKNMILLFPNHFTLKVPKLLQQKIWKQWKSGRTFHQSYLCTIFNKTQAGGDSCIKKKKTNFEFTLISHSEIVTETDHITSLSLLFDCCTFETNIHKLYMRLALCKSYHSWLVWFKHKITVWSSQKYILTLNWLLWNICLTEKKFFLWEKQLPPI